MSRHKGSKNKKTLLREAFAELKSQDEQNGLWDKAEILDPLAIMQEAMRHFYFKARFEKTRPQPNKARIDAAYLNAVDIAKALAPFKHPTYATVRLTGDPNAPKGDTNIEKLRAEILWELEDLGVFEPGQKAIGIAGAPRE